MTSKSQIIRPGIIRLAVLMCISLLTGCQNAVTTSNQVTSSNETTMTSVRTSPLTVPRPDFEAKSIEEAESVSVGDHISFGRYPQRRSPDTDSFEPEPIEWRVLDIQDGKALLITEYLLKPISYNTTLEDVTWETCSLRKWCNDTFYDAAFSEDEKRFIQTVTLKNPDNPLRGTPGGNDTEDRLFCLSLEEAKIYFKDQGDRWAVPTDYAINERADTHEENGIVTGWWWLRTPASSANRASDVDCYGETDWEINGYGEDGDFVIGSNCVRPAVWISIPEKNEY